MLFIRFIILLLILPILLSCSNFHPKGGGIEISKVSKIKIYYYPAISTRFSLSMDYLRKYGSLKKEITDVNLIKKILTFPKIKGIKPKDIQQDFRLVMDCYNILDNSVYTIAVTANNQLIINYLGYRHVGRYAPLFAATIAHQAGMTE